MYIIYIYIYIIHQCSNPTFGDSFPHQRPRRMPPAVERPVPSHRLWKHGFARPGFGTPSPPAVPSPAKMGHDCSRNVAGYSWLVVFRQPSEKYDFVSWDDDSQYMET